MKIVWAEKINGGQELYEKSSKQEIFRARRDVEDCQIVFENAKFPMVSRKHAELRADNG